jgi:hypothetical protein
MVETLSWLKAFAPETELASSHECSAIQIGGLFHEREAKAYRGEEGSEATLLVGRA